MKKALLLILVVLAVERFPGASTTTAAADFATATPAVCAPLLTDAAEVLCLDSYSDWGRQFSRPVWTTRVLARGLTYAVTVDGTYSVWLPGQWEADRCGTPLPAPHYPSPDVDSGPVGLDAETLFATPFDCATLDPRRSFNLRFQLDPETFAFHPNPVASDPGSHRYTYRLTGRGFRVGAAIFDRPVTDNYGQLRLHVALADRCAAIVELKTAVQALGLARGIETSLTSKLSAAARACEAGALGPASALLQAFSREVEAQRGRAIGEDDATYALLAGARDIIAALNE